MLDDAFRELRSDAFDEPGAEVALDALDRRGQDRRVVLDVKLPAVLRVRAPASAHPQRLAGLGTEQRADDGEQVGGAAPGVHARDRVTGLLVGVSNAFEYAFEHGEMEVWALALSLRILSRRHGRSLSGGYDRPARNMRVPGRGCGQRIER